MTLRSLSQKAETWIDKVKGRFRHHGNNDVAIVPRDEAREQLADTPSAAPPMDVYEGDHRLVIVADVPGANRRSTEVTWDGERTLGIDAAAPALRWQRTFTLPFAYDGANAKASVHDGVLTITVPRDAARAPKRIAVHAG